MEKKTILIADDDKEYVEVLQSYLEHHGFQIISAYEGVRAIMAAHREKPDLIILDMKMPAGEGDTTLQALRSKEVTKNIPVIIATGLNKREMEKECLANGAQAFIQKPFDHQALLKLIGICLG